MFDQDVVPESGWLALHPGEGYGLLRVMEPDERPNPRDVVIYEALPNELPRVAGIVTTALQGCACNTSRCCPAPLSCGA